MKPLIYALVTLIIGLFVFPHWGQAAFLAILVLSVCQDNEALKKTEADIAASRLERARLNEERRLRWSQRQQHRQRQS